MTVSSLLTHSSKISSYSRFVFGKRSPDEKRRSKWLFRSWNKQQKADDMVNTLLSHRFQTNNQSHHARSIVEAVWRPTQHKSRWTQVNDTVEWRFISLSVCPSVMIQSNPQVICYQNRARAFIHNKSINKLSQLFVESTRSLCNTERTISKPLRLTTGNINKHYIALYLSIPRAATTPKDDEPTGISITERCCYFYTKKNTTSSRLERFFLLLLCSASIFSRKTYTSPICCG